MTNLKTNVSRKQSSPNFLKNQHFLPPDTHTYVCVLGGKKCSFFGKFGALCFLEISLLRLALLPYYRRKWVANLKLIIIDLWLTTLGCTAQKMEFSTEDFFSKCDQIRNFLRISSHLLKKSFMENFIFSAVLVNYKVPGLMRQLSKSCDIIPKNIKHNFIYTFTKFHDYMNHDSKAVFKMFSSCSNNTYHDVTTFEVDGMV